MLRSASFLAVLLFAANASAQDETPPPPATAPEAKTPSFSIALERVGGIGYAKASSSENDSGVSITAIGVGGVTPNPFAVPRLGLDFILPSQLTLGAGLGFTRLSGSASSGSQTEDVGSVLLYTATPRIGYRIPLSEHVDLTPRAGLTLAGASYSPPNDRGGASIFAIALGADAPLAYRVTDSFNLMAGFAIDYTVSATVTSESTSTTVGPGGTTTSSSTKTEDIKGTLFSMQAWLGIGGYL